MKALGRSDELDGRWEEKGEAPGETWEAGKGCGEKQESCNIWNNVQMKKLQLAVDERRVRRFFEDQISNVRRKRHTCGIVYIAWC